MTEEERLDEERKYMNLPEEREANEFAANQVKKLWPIFVNKCGNR